MCSDGDLTIFQEEEMTEAERLMRKERAGGNYGAGTKEIQVCSPPSAACGQLISSLSDRHAAVATARAVQDCVMPAMPPS